MATTTAQPTTDTPSKPDKRDFRQEVTDRITNMLEKGVAPWQKPWEPGPSSLGMPINPTTDKAYRGGNAIHLMATALQRRYEDPRWMTYKQASDHGWQVRKGEKGTQIEFWEVKPAADKGPQPAQPQGSDEQRGGQDRDRASRLIHRVYTVFNASQIDRIPAYEPKQRTVFDAVQSGERMLSSSGAMIRHDQPDRAFYNRASDSIHLPPKDTFKDPAGYYGTALHELAHWTGHPSRLNRPTLNESYRFGDTNYAKEELRAELASVFLAAERGIPHDPEQHAAYVGSWIKALKEDKNEIFRAAHDASAATDFLYALERDQSIAEQMLAAGPVMDTATAGSSRAAVLEDQTTALDRDRDSATEQTEEQLSHTPSTEPNANEHAAPPRESAEFSARHEPDSATVNVEHKATGTDRRTTVDPQQLPPSNSESKFPGRGRDGTDTDSLDAARAITAKALGPGARTLAAQTDSGAYRGPIIGETPDHLVQRQTARSAIAHQKELLDRQPQIGENAAINYSSGKAMVREIRERAKAKDLGR